MKSLVCPVEQVEMILRHPSQPKVWASDLTVHLILKQWFVDSIRILVKINNSYGLPFKRNVHMLLCTQYQWGTRTPEGHLWSPLNYQLVLTILRSPLPIPVSVTGLLHGA